MVRARLLISGRVQGVFYRATCQDEAAARGLVGWVRNLPDGRVEVIAEGGREDLDAFGADLAMGTGPSKISRIEVTDLAPTGSFSAFTIAR